MNAVTSKRKASFSQKFYIKYRQVLWNAPTIREFGMGRFLYICWDARHLITMTLGDPSFHTGNRFFRITLSGFYSLQHLGSRVVQTKEQMYRSQKCRFSIVLLMRTQWPERSHLACLLCFDFFFSFKRKQWFMSSTSTLLMGHRCSCTYNGVMS